MQPLNLVYLQTHLRRIDLLLHLAVQHAQAAGFDPNNEFQGLFVAEEEVERHLSLPPGSGFWGKALALDEAAQAQLDKLGQQLQQIEAEAHRAKVSLRLLDLEHALALSPDDMDMLLISLAPALDRRYERIYGFLQDDVTKRRPTVNLVLNLLGQEWTDRNRLLARLTDEAPLIRQSLLAIQADAADPNSAQVNRMLRIDPRIVRYVQGIDDLPKTWLNFVRFIETPEVHADDLILPPAAELILSRDFGNVVPMYHLYGLYGSGRHTIAQILATRQGYPLLEVDLQLQQRELGDLQQLDLILREGRLRHAALMLLNWDSVLSDQHDPPRWIWDALLAYTHPVIISGKESWEPRGSKRTRPVIRLDLAVPEFQDRLAFWQKFLGETDLDPSELAYKFKLTGGQVRDAVDTAFDIAAGKGISAPTLGDLYAASRAQSTRKLSSLAVKITPRYDWESIVLPPDRIQQLREICDQVKYAVTVYGQWGFKGRGASAQGLSALFAGQSGTGKTMAAEIIATELGLELFKVDLSSVVSKYIGETEKNLAAIFDEAAQSNAILFFDEADALFGKRSEVKDSHDRYANIEIGYLLQRMETYDGVAILASNLRQNLDEAFTRRLDFLIDFPFPEDEDRVKIWRISFPQDAPLGSDVDLMLLARRYRMAGGNIRNAALASAFLAAADSAGSIRMGHIMHAIRREHQKMGKLMEG